MKRHFLFLQGICSPFFAALAEQLRHDGHTVSKVNFNVGDWFYWGKGQAKSYRGRLTDLGGFLDFIFGRECVTDQVLFGDLRPVHLPALEAARIRGIRNHVYEEGYFRPYWVTLEREGVNSHSLLPKEPGWYRQVEAVLPKSADVVSFRSPFSLRALHDVAYHCAGALNPFFFPRYRTHAPVTAPVEYLGYMRRFPALRAWKRRDAAVIESLSRSGDPYYVLPLQLNGDAQIRYHSQFEGMEEVIDLVMASFAREAPAQARLVIKNHPLDMWLVDYQRFIEHRAKHFDIEGRIDYLETGNLEVLLEHARGVITVNSTVGGVSLGLGCPTICLADPIYNLSGLTFEGEIDDFWRHSVPPDEILFRQFKRVVMFTTQVNGGFYCRKGIGLAVSNSAAVLAAEKSPLESLL